MASSGGLMALVQIGDALAGRWTAVVVTLGGAGMVGFALYDLFKRWRRR